ncbi:MAG: sugar ABC transporter permease, partial [Kiloniellales bacterium]|nr:sugar ABC transporter permease [Kiloniellales bacterium]
MTTQTGRLGGFFFPSVQRTDSIGFLFVAFFGIPFFLFNLLPVFFGAYVSLTEWGIVGQPHWVGLDNYREGLSDPAMAQAFLNTLLYAVIIVPSVTVLGLLAALYVNQGWPLSGLTRTLFFAPHVVSATVIGLVWVWIFDTRFGILNFYLGQVGLQPVPWLTSTDWSLLSVSIASVWWDLGLSFVLLGRI